MSLRPCSFPAVARLRWTSSPSRCGSKLPPDSRTALTDGPTRLQVRMSEYLRRARPADIDGTEVTLAEGKAIVIERYQVPEEVRRRRRTKKAGKVPHEVPTARSGRGDPPRTS